MTTSIGSLTLRLARQVVFVLVILALSGCGGYGEMSPLAYEYAKALYSVCNRQDQGRLELLRERIISSREQAELTARESDWLTDIIASADEGDWESAVLSTRRLMEDQVRGR